MTKKSFHNLAGRVWFTVFSFANIRRFCTQIFNYGLGGFLRTLLHVKALISVMRSRRKMTNTINLKRRWCNGVE